jgi:hypothetical protein
MERVADLALDQATHAQYVALDGAEIGIELLGDMVVHAGFLQPGDE